VCVGGGGGHYVEKLQQSLDEVPMTRHMMATASAVLQLRTQFLRVLSRPVKTLNKPFESLQSAAEPRQGAFRRSYCYTLYIIYLHVHLSFVLADTELRTASTFCISEKRRVLHGVPTQEAAIFRTQAQLCRKCQQGVGSIGYAGGANSCSCLSTNDNPYEN
jgi:hypothetical protein